MGSQDAERLPDNMAIYAWGVCADHHHSAVPRSKRAPERVRQPGAKMPARLRTERYCANPVEPNAHGVTAGGGREPHGRPVARLHGGSHDLTAQAAVQRCRGGWTDLPGQSRLHETGDGRPGENAERAALQVIGPRGHGRAKAPGVAAVRPGSTGE